MKASVITLAFFSAAAIANPVTVEKREIEPRAIDLVPVLTGITGGAGLGNLGNIAVISGLVKPEDVLPAFSTLLQTILNIVAAIRAGVPGNTLPPVTAIGGVPDLTDPVSSISAPLSPEQVIALALGLQNSLGNLTALTANLPGGTLLGGGLNAAQLTTILNGITGLQTILGPVLNAGGALSNLGNLGGLLSGGAVPNIPQLQSLLSALTGALSIVTGLLGLLTGIGGLLGGGLGGGLLGGIGA